MEILNTWNNHITGLSANFDALATLVVFFTNVITGMVVFLGNRKSKVNYGFLVLTYTIAMWSVLRFTWLKSGTPEQALFWVRALMLPVVFIPTTYLQFVFALLGISEIKKKLLRTAYFISAFFFLSDLTPLFLSATQATQYYAFRPVPGPLFHLFMILWTICITYALRILFVAYRSSEGVRREQLKYVLIGWIIGFTGGSTNYLLFYNIPWLPFGLGNWSVLAYILCIFYAIVKFNLFSVKVVTIEFLTFAIWILSAARLLYSHSALDVLTDISFLVLMAVLGILIIRSALNEERQKEQLADLNLHLEEEVREQTEEIRKAYEVEKTARLELETLDKVKNQFLLTTQHHLRTPLTIVKGYLQSFLNKKSSKLDKEGKQYLEKISEGTERVNHLVEELLDITQVQIREVGKEVAHTKSVELKSLVEHVIDDLKLQIEKRHIQVSLTIPDELLVNIQKEKMRAALRSVLENAIIYNHDGGSVSITGERLIHPIEKDKKFVRITIKDTGIGLSKEEIPTLFSQYFQRGDEAVYMHAAGRGLALAIVRNIINVHNGRIWVESEGKGKGSAFIIELPA